MASCSKPPIVELISNARRGSSGALGRLLDDCRPYLLLIANRELDPAVRPKVAASDVVQQTFLDAHRDFDQFTGATEEALLRWLRQILVHNIRDAVRHYCRVAKRGIAREVPLELIEEGVAACAGSLATTQSPSWEADVRERQRNLERALEQLPKDQYDAIVLRNLQLLSFVEIGRLMDRSPEAARKLWSRGVKTLSRRLSGEGSL